MRRALASRRNVFTSSKLFKPGELIPEEMPALSGGELLDQMENDTGTVTLTSEGITNTRNLVQHHLGMKEAVKRFDLKKRMVEKEMANKKEGSKKVGPRERIRQRLQVKKATIGRKGLKTRRERLTKQPTM